MGRDVFRTLVAARFRAIYLSLNRSIINRPIPDLDSRVRLLCESLSARGERSWFSCAIEDRRCERKIARPGARLDLRSSSHRGSSPARGRCRKLFRSSCAALRSLSETRDSLRTRASEDDVLANDARYGTPGPSLRGYIRDIARNSRILRLFSHESQ